MGDGFRLNPGGRAWAGLACVLGASALLCWPLPAPWLDWQPALAWSQPWRAFTAACVHWSTLHLLVNLLATAVVCAYGVAAGVPLSCTAAWAVAWPLGHLLLLAVKPDLLHYGGLSGVLHAGVAIVSAWLLCQRRGRRQAVGAAIALGLLIKLASEAPWGPALRSSAEWDIALAPVAHACGAAAGLLSFLLLGCWRQQRRGAEPIVPP